MKKVTTLLKGFFLLVCCLAIASLATAQTNWGGWCYRDYSSDGTFTVPANCTQLYIEAIGAGGGGGNAVAPSILTPNHTSTGTGGGGGAYARKHVTNPSGNYTITIGVGGGPAAAGGATTVTGTGCSITAGGGQPGQSDIHGTGSTGTGGSGGSASGGDANHSGGRGGKVCDNRDTEAGSLHDRVGSGAGGGAAGGNGNGGYQDQPTNDHANSTNTVGAGGGGSVHGLSNNYSSVSTWYKGGNGGAGKDGGSGWGNGDTGGYPGGGGSGARTKGYQGNKSGGRGANGFVRVWFYTEKSEPLTVSIENQSTTCPYTLKATTSNYLFTNTLQWNTGATGSTLANLSPSNNTTYSATVTDKHNYASHTCQITSTASIEVNKCQDCGVTIASATASASEVCVGGPSFLSATLESDDPNASYAWSVNNYNAGTSTSLSNYLVTPTSTTTYAIKVTITKGNCTASDTRNITVTVNEKVDPIFASLFNDGYCASTLPAVDDLPPTSDNNFTGTWAYSTSDSTYTFTPDAGQCANKFTKKVTISDDPTPGEIEPNIVVCDNQTIYTFNNATSAAGGINGSYAWQVSLDQNTWAQIPDATNDSYVPMTDLNAMATLLDASATGTFYFRRAWTNGCGDVYSNVLSLDNPGTLTPGSLTADGDQAGAYCADAAVTATLTAHPSAAGLPNATFSVKWQKKDSNGDWVDIPDAVGYNYLVSLDPGQEGSYRYMAKYSSCDWMTSNNTYDITVNELPTVSLAGTTVCEGGTATVTPTFGDDVTAYKWDNATEWTTGTPAALEYTVTGSHTHTLTVKNDNGCEATSNSATAVVNELPTVLIEGENPYSVEKCKNTDITLTASGASTYKWSGSGSTANPATFSAAGTFTVTGTDANGCSSTASVTIAENTLSVSITETMVDCYTNDQGYVTFTVSGGHPQFQAVLVKNNVDGTSMTVGTGESQFNGGIEDGTYKIKVTEVGESQCTVVSEPVEIAFPTVTFTAPAAESFTLPYGVGEMNVTLVGTPEFTPTDGAFTYTNDLDQLNPMGVGTHTVTWTLKDACSNIVGTAQQVVNVVLPECEDAVTLDGYDYPVVRVGYDCWFKENVKATTDIADVVAYKNDPDTYKDKFGMLYTWYAAVAAEPETGSEEGGSGSGPALMMPMPIPPVNPSERTQGICPEGWAIPTVEDFQRLFVAAGSDVAYLKDMDATTWTTGKCGIEPSTGFDARGAGYYLSSIAAFQDLLSNTRFWTDKAGSTANKATCCEFNYYCDEPMFKEISSFDKVSVRCIKINSEELPTPPPAECPSVGTPTIEFIDGNATSYHYYDISKLTLKISTPILDYDALQVGNATYYAYYTTPGHDYPVNHTIASTGYTNPEYANAYFTEDGVFVAEIQGRDDNFLGQWGQIGEITISLKVAINCAPDGFAWSEDVPFTPATDCPAYLYSPMIDKSLELETIKVTAYLNDFTSGAVDVNSVSWKVTSDDGTTRTYTPANNNGNDINVNASVSDHTQVITLSWDQVAADFVEPATLTFVPSMGTMCEGSPVTVTGFPATYPIAPVSTDDCPTFEDDEFEVTLENGQYIAEIPFEFEGTGDVSVSGNYYTEPYTIAPLKYDLNGDMYHVTDNTIFVHIPVNASGLSGELSEGQSLNINISIDYPDCPGALISGAYEAPAAPVECPTMGEINAEPGTTNNTYIFTAQVGNYDPNEFYAFAVITTTYKFVAGVTIQYPAIVQYNSDDAEYSSYVNNEGVITWSSGVEGVDSISVTFRIEMPGTDCEIAYSIRKVVFEQPDVECPTTDNTELNLEKGNSYYVQIPYTGGSGNETVSGVYFIGEVMGEETNPLDNQFIVLDKTNKTITVSIPFTEVTLNPGQTIGVVLTLSDDDCNPMTIYCQYTEPTASVVCPSIGEILMNSSGCQNGVPSIISVGFEIDNYDENMVDVDNSGILIKDMNQNTIATLTVGTNNNNSHSIIISGNKLIASFYNHYSSSNNEFGSSFYVVPFLRTNCSDGMIGDTYHNAAGDPVLVTCEYDCPTLVGTQVGVNNNLEIIATTTVQGLANVSDATRYGYDVVASASFMGQNYNKTLTVDQETEGFVVVLNDILGASVNLLNLIPAGFQSQDLLTMFLENGGIVNITVTPFIEVTDTSCGTNGRITGEPKSYQYPQ